MNGGADTGWIPAKVSENIRATVTAGLAKLVDDVKKYAAPMYAPTAGATTIPFRRGIRNMTDSRPRVAITSASHKSGPLRTFVDQFTAGSANIRLASIVPAMPPINLRPDVCNALFHRTPLATPHPPA